MSLGEKIRSNTEALLQALSPLSEEQAGYKRDASTWSVLECLEHIFLVNSNVLRVISSPDDKASPGSSPELFGEGKLNHLLVNKRAEHKLPAPEFVSPAGQLKSLEEGKAKMQELTERIIRYLDENDISTKTDTIKHARLGEMTRLDWVYFLLAHTNRHLLQIEELKSFQSTAEQ